MVEDGTRSEDAGFDPERREMCPDGMCVGVIGPDGRCRVCGKPGSKDASGEPAAPKTGSAKDGPAEWRPKAPPADGDAAAADAPDFARERVPCPDGMCTGVVGRNGRCGTCGKPWDWKES